VHSVRGTVARSATAIRAQFATRLLGRLVFLRFLAKKNIVPESFFDPETPRDITYYQKTLGPLFFETLNTPQDQRRASLPKDFAKIPYLNGGLFEASPHDGWPNPAFFIPPDWFKSLFEIFQAYNFTVDENSLQDVEIAVDPEMLGQIFENLLATENTDTGQSARDAHGTFYTPREVVDYLCRQSLRLRVSTLHPELTEAHLDALLNLEPGPELTNLGLDKGLLLRSLDSLKIFDPAVGSGAFPMGMLHVLAGAYERLDHRYHAYKVKLKIIKSNLYGADIEPMAIELAKLRCWLSLMVETDTIKVPPLPNLDLKFFCLNTLFDPPKLDSDDLFLQNGLVELDALERDFFSCTGLVRVEFDAPARTPLTADWSETQSRTPLLKGTAPGLDLTARSLGCLDYRAMLETNFVHRSGRVNLFPLIVHSLLRHTQVITGATRSTPLGDLWHSVLTRRPSSHRGHKWIGQVEHAAGIWNSNFAPLIGNLTHNTNRLLQFFDSSGMTVALQPAELAYSTATRQFEGRAVWLDVSLHGKVLAEPQHFLNEARLSALALALFLAGYQLNSSAPLEGGPDYARVLVLDDVLIGLDYANRIPLLKLLDAEFRDWQVLLFTHDEVWFELAREFTEGGKRWKYTKILGIRDAGGGVAFPQIHEDPKDDITVASQHLAKGEP